MPEYEFSLADFESPSWYEVFINEKIKSLLGALVYGKTIRQITLTGAEKVLDFGCGNGVATRLLANQLVDGGEVVGLEPSKFWSRKALARLKGHKNVSVVTQPIAAAGFDRNMFDVVTVFHVLHDIPPGERAETMRQLAEVMRPGGRILIWEPTGLDHGMAVAEIRQLAIDAGLNIRYENEAKKDFTAVFNKSL